MCVNVLLGFIRYLLISYVLDKKKESNDECLIDCIKHQRMRKFKRIIHKQFGGVGNFFAMIVLVSITVIFINTYVLSKRDCKFEI
jgi:hypothetical protein